MREQTRLTHIMKPLALGVVTLVVTFASDAQTGQAADPIAAEVIRQDIAGLAVAVVRAGEVERISAYGLANRELGVPVTGDTVFQTGSTAKQFVALGILMLEADGKLSIDDSFSEFFPDAPPHWRDIKLRHMMVHLSGLEEDPPNVDYQQSPSPEELRHVFFRTRKTGAAGTNWVYSNSAYALLGMVIEKVAGTPYHQFLEERIFRPLGMHATRQISESDLIPHRADGYERVDNTAGAALRNQRWVSPVFNSTADGSTYTTPKDFARYLASLESPPAHLSPFFEAMFQPAAAIGPGSHIFYGYGWFLTEIGGIPVQYHSGSWQGFRVNLIRYPEQKTSLVIFANSDMPERQKLIETVVADALPGFPVPTEW